MSKDFAGDLPFDFNPNNLNLEKLSEQFQKFTKTFNDMNQKIAALNVTGHDGPNRNFTVHIQSSGEKGLKAIEINVKPAVKQWQTEQMEEAILKAINDAFEKIERSVRSVISDVSRDLGIDEKERG